MPPAGNTVEPGADILVVGSDAEGADATRAPLEEAGHRVRVASDAAAALDELGRGIADVTITEWPVEGDHGDALCRAIRSDPELNATHLIALLAEKSQDRPASVLEAGADDYVVVPFEPAELLARVRSGRQAAQLRASEVRLRALMANVPGAIYRCAPDRDWTMEVISDEIERISGYPPSDFVESSVRTFASVIHDEDRDAVEAAVFEACDAGRPFVLEYRIQRPDGNVTWVLERGQLVHGTNGRTWLDGAIFDVSARREAETQRREKEAEQARSAELRASRARIIEATDRARRQLERDLHDGAQQQFIAVALSLRLLVDEIRTSAPDLVEEAQEVLEAIQVAIDDLRQVAQGIHPAVLSERGLVRAVEALVTRMPMPARLRKAPAERLPGPVEAALYYVIAESVTNAYKHAGAREVVIDVGHENGRAWAEVIDDGEGGASIGGGSGLEGLSDRVEALDGTLSLRSPPGGGTRVRAEVSCD